MSGTLFCFGLGYSALRLACALTREGWDVAGTCRTEEKRAELEAEGITTYLMNHSEQPDPSVFDAATHALVSIPPDADGDPVARTFGDPLARSERLQWLGYLSTTGVYGDKQGGWVDENTPVDPNTERGARRVAAERAWLALYQTQGLPVHIFRLAGIYGPGRNQLESVRAGNARRIVKPGQFFSRIHVDDIVRVLRASMAHPRPGAVYNVCDDEAAPPQDVVAYAAQLLGVDAPPEIPFEEARLTPMARSFYADNKRVRNDRIKTELGVSLAYPTYREGLEALVRTLASERA
ncbi:MAG: SDR family oxidoreductase [Alphaproteobacteria bacterium]|nr:MAG: SDR family oxidoreductase [Alphaproteobacteria bacterium]